MSTVLTFRQLKWLAASCGLLTITAVAAAQSVPVSAGGGFFLQASPIYQGPTVLPSAPGMWSVDTLLNSGSIRKPTGVVGNQFRINSNEVEITWTGNQLNQDLSSPVSGSWLAEATFLDGGTLTLTGTIRDAAVPYTARYTGTLLTATVSGFHLRETDKDGNMINSIDTTIRLDPTGGYLYDNPYVNLRGLYDFALVGAVVGPVAGGSLDNFQTDLKSLQAFQINFTQVPEPTTAMILSLGAVVVLVRRRPVVR